jgi:hypothetical protein
VGTALTIAQPIVSSSMPLPLASAHQQMPSLLRTRKASVPGRLPRHRQVLIALTDHPTARPGSASIELADYGVVMVVTVAGLRMPGTVSNPSPRTATRSKSAAVPIHPPRESIRATCIP